MAWECQPFEVLEGKTISSIDGMKEGNSSVFFNCTDGTRFVMANDLRMVLDMTLEDKCGSVVE